MTCPEIQPTTQPLQTLPADVNEPLTAIADKSRLLGESLREYYDRILPPRFVMPDYMLDALSGPADHERSQAALEEWISVLCLIDEDFPSAGRQARHQLLENFRGFRAGREIRPKSACVPISFDAGSDTYRRIWNELLAAKGLAPEPKRSI